MVDLISTVFLSLVKKHVRNRPVSQTARQPTYHSKQGPAPAERYWLIRTIRHSRSPPRRTQSDSLGTGPGVWKLHAHLDLLSGPSGHTFALFSPVPYNIVGEGGANSQTARSSPALPPFCPCKTRTNKYVTPFKAEIVQVGSYRLVRQQRFRMRFRIRCLVVRLLSTRLNNCSLATLVRPYIFVPLPPYISPCCFLVHLASTTSSSLLAHLSILGQSNFQGQTKGYFPRSPPLYAPAHIISNLA